MTLYQNLQKLVDEEASKKDTHNLMLAVQSGDRQIDFRGCAGATVTSPFYIASITKMFTATLILRLQDQGLIDLDTTAQSILNQYDLSDLHTVENQAYGPHLTIRHLLQQTSGLADYYESDVAIALKRGKDQAYDLNDVLRITKGLPPQSAPASGKAHYSDTNYQLLGAIIETVTAQSFSKAVQTHICAPLGMTETFVMAQNLVEAPVPLTIYNQAKALHPPLTLSSMGPDGGIISTLNDMMLFLKAYMKNTLFDPQNESDARQFQKLYFPLQYGFGLMRFKLPRWINLFRETPELIGHSGASGSFAFYAPKEDIYLTGTFNQVDAPKRPYAFMMRVMQTLARHGVSK